MRRGEEVPYYGGDDEPQSEEKKILQGIIVANNMKWALKMGSLSDRLGPSHFRRLPARLTINHEDGMHQYADRDARKYERVKNTRRRLAMGSGVLCLLAGAYGLASIMTEQARIDPPLMTETDASYAVLAKVAGDPEKLRELEICAPDVLMQSYYQTALVEEGRLMADRQMVNSAAYITAVEAKLPCRDKTFSDDDRKLTITMGTGDNKQTISRQDMVGIFWATNWPEERDDIINQAYNATGSASHDLDLMLKAGDQATHYKPINTLPSVQPLG